MLIYVKNKLMHIQFLLATGLLFSNFLIFSPVSHAQPEESTNPCGEIPNHYGPFDYRKANKQQRNLVEHAHFTPGVESLRRQLTGPFGGDIAYTLRVFPNHPRALLAMQRLAEKTKKDVPESANFSIECYYERALRFQPFDNIVRMLYASFLIKKGQPTEATKQLDFTIENAGGDPFTHYNIGLIFLDMKNYDRALLEAHRAQELGFLRPELKQGLQDAGKWIDLQRLPAPANSEAGSK